MNKTFTTTKEQYEQPLLQDIQPVTVHGDTENEDAVSNWDTENGTGNGD